MEFTKNNKRAERRQHTERLKKKRSKDFTFHDEMPINRHVITPTVCSCEGCGNPRNHNGNSECARTIQERKVLQREKY